MDIYRKLMDMGINLPKTPVPAGIYKPVVDFDGNMIYTSGMGPKIEGKPTLLGKIGKDLTLEQGQEAARNCMLNILGAVAAKTGDLNRIARVVKVLGFVASADDFYDQPKVINGASQLLVDVLGEENGKAARSAIGTSVLPGNIPVEIEAIFELKK